jgi:AcrR family transcriptional regulator
MARPRLYSDAVILDSARTVVLEAGARATTIDAIAAASGAPKGSLYNRYPSLDDLLATLWLRAAKRAQRDFIAETKSPDALAAALAAALSLYDFAEREPADARLLASMRREDLVLRTLTPRLTRELEQVNRELQMALGELAERLFGETSALEITVCAVVDLPLGLLRRHLVAGDRLPAGLRGRIASAVNAILLDSSNDLHQPNPKRRAHVRTD